MFQAFGISATAEAVYRALLRDPYARPDDLGERMSAGVPAVQAAVAELAAYGLVQAGSFESGRLTVVPPERAVESLIAHEEQALAERRRAVLAARSGITDLVAEFVEGRRERTERLVEQVHGSDAVRSRLYQLSQQCERQVCSVNPGPAPPEVALDASRRMDEQSRARGVHSRSVFAGVAAADPAMARYLTDSVAAGDGVRIHPAPPVRMLLIDEGVAVIPIDDEDHTVGAYVVHGGALLTPLIVLFETIWRDSARFDPAVEAQLSSDEARMRQVVALLAEGAKDEAIARRLAISVRTVRRLIALAIDRLQAQSRFQAGVLAVRRGWVSGEPPVR